jgi:hypothetical protein
MRLLWTALVCSIFPAVAAEQPFTGTWKVDLSKIQFSKKPDKIEIANGMYKCLSCDPPVAVKADASDQPVAGHPGFNSMSVRIVDDHVIETVSKQDGKVVSEEKITISPDGAVSTIEFTGHPPASEKPVTGNFTAKRTGKAPAGMHLASGDWVPDKFENITENALMTTFEQTADALKMSAPTGDHYDAKFDGKEYPLEGSQQADKVILKRLGPREIQETDKRGGNVVSTTRMTVSADGKTMTMVNRDRQGRVTTLVWDKQ